MRSRVELIVAELNQLRELIVKVANSNREVTTPEKRSESASGDSSTGEAASSNAEDESNPSSEEARNKLQLLRVQQSVSQVEKSSGELTGVAQEIGQISRELVNNRIDSQDRQDRFREQGSSAYRSSHPGATSEASAAAEIGRTTDQYWAC